MARRRERARRRLRLLPAPPAAVDAAVDAATRLDSPFLAIDLAEQDDGKWICLESNDGGASGPAPEQDLAALRDQLEQER